MNKGVFISYRREDSSGYTGRLSDDLNEILVENRIFRDIETIEPGMDFVESINKAVDSCAVLLVVIGPRWLTVADAAGQSRLSNPNDYNRIEIATALKRNIRVVPILVGDAAMPAAEDLPDDLKALARRQALELSDSRWKYDIEALISVLEKIPGVGRRATAENRTSPPAKRSSGKKIATILGAVILAIVAIISIGSMMGSPTDIEMQQSMNEPAVEQAHELADKPTDVLAEKLGNKRADEPPSDRPESTRKQTQNRERPRPADLHGVWGDGVGFIYELTQEGGSIQINVLESVSFGPVGYGEGTIEGRLLSSEISATLFDDWGNAYSETFRAQMTLSDDEQRLEGRTTARSTGIVTPVLLFRVNMGEAGWNQNSP